MGKTTDRLHTRINGHRSKFYYVLKHSANPADFFDDEQILGAHIVHDHGLLEKTDFDNNYTLYILGYSNPASIRRSEQFWIDKLKTRTPFGLNQNDSIGSS